MRKYLRWQIPFADIDKNQYVVNIYANQAPDGEPKVFVGIGGEDGTFTHNEDESEDPSLPVRTQTATLSIANTEGNLNMIDEVMPRDNTKRFVQVCSLGEDGKPNAVLWQGFLSSDSFSQEYKSRPNAIEININSMLMAMDSVPCKQQETDADGIGGIVTVKEAIEYVLNTMANMSGVAGVVTDYYVPYYSKAILEKKINTHGFFGVVKRTYTDHEDLLVEGVSLKKILEDICTYMHWTVRERGTKFYFQDKYAGMSGRYDHYTYYNGGWTRAGSKVPAVVPMRDYIYMGTEHTKSISRGARFVEVSAKMSKYDDFAIPECPFSRIERKVMGGFYYSESQSPAALEAVVCKNGEYFSHIYLENKRKATLEPMPEWCEVKNIELATEEEVVEGFPNMPALFGWDDTIIYGGAYFARMELIVDSTDFLYHKMQSGLLISMLPTEVFLPPVFRMVSPKVYSIKDGYLHVSIKALLGGYCGAGTIWFKYMMDKMGDEVKNETLQMNIYLKIAIRCGDKFFRDGQWYEIDPRYPFWNTGAFGASLNGSDFKLNITDKKVDAKSGLLLPVKKEDNLSGQIEIVIFPTAVNAPSEKERTGDLPPDVYTHKNIVTMAFLSSLSIKYIPAYDHLLSDASDNRYIDITGFDFNETESIDSEFATTSGNLSAPSLVMESDLDPMEALDYITDDGITIRRMKPELKALEDIRKFYSAPRRVIDLEVRPQQEDAPAIIITGYDGKTYYPISEQHDWFLNRTTMRCLEIGSDEGDTDPDNEEPPSPPVVPNYQFPGGGDNTGDGGGQDNDQDTDQDNPTDPTDPDDPDWGDPDDDGRDDGPDGPDWDGPDWDY